MAWYRTGSATFTNGSPTVTGSGTAWAANIQAGDAIKGPDQVLNEVQSVNSDTSITMAGNYGGATAAGAAYAIIPTQGRVRDLAAQVVALIGDFGAVVAGAGAGKFGDGTAATPGVSFAADPDTGFYRIGANALGISTGGVGRFALDSSGNLGLSTTTPQARLSVATTGDAVGLSLGEAGSATGKTLDIGYFITANYGRIQAVHAGAGFKDLALNPSGGNVGVGTTAPATKLEVSGASAIARVSGTAGTSPRLELASAGAVNWGFRSNNFGGSELTVFQDAVERVRLDGSGNLGIGTASPSQKLDVSHTSSPILALRNSGGAGATATLSDLFNSSAVSTNNGNLIFYNANNTVERMRIDSAGNVGIGTSTPAYKLHVQGSSIGLIGSGADAAITVAGTSTSALFGTDAAGAYVAANSAAAVRFVTGGVERMRLDGGGALFLALPSASPAVPIGAMSFSRVSNTVARLHMRGSDNIQRYVDFTLTP